MVVPLRTATTNHPFMYRLWCRDIRIFIVQQYIYEISFVYIYKQCTMWNNFDLLRDLSLLSPV